MNCRTRQRSNDPNIPTRESNVSKISAPAIPCTASPRTAADPTSLWSVVGLAMAPAVALGFARFAYALLLPAMRADLGWSYANAGAMNTANAAGYLVGALAAAAIAARWGLKTAFMLSLAATVVAVAASGLTADFGVLIALRLAAGAFGAVALVTGSSLAAAAATGGGPSRAPIVLGLYFSGGGIGVLVSALIVPTLVASHGWRGGWFALGALSFAASVVAALALAHVSQPAQAANDGRRERGWSMRFMAPELVGYGLFGAGYIAYATFIVAYLRGAQAFTPIQVSLFWALLGLASIMAAFAWGPILARLTGGRGAAATIAMVTVGAVLPLIWDGAVAACLSAILFGGSFLAVVAAVTSFARRTAAPHAWTAAIGALTVAFGTGQCIGPVLSGVLSDGQQGVRAGLLVSVAILALAAVVATFQAEPHWRTHGTAQ